MALWGHKMGRGDRAAVDYCTQARKQSELSMHGMELPGVRHIHMLIHIWGSVTCRHVLLSQRHTVLMLIFHVSDLHL